MEITKIEIFGYGKLSHQEFTFNRFQAILGSNEAGKTTMINFMKDMLFGFTKRKSTHPYAPKDKSEMGGKIFINVDNIIYIVERVEGKNGGDLKITDDKGTELPSEMLKKVLGPINRNTFDNLFYFGSPNLAEIGKLSKDELETRIRQVGVIGIEQWLELKKSIEKEADGLYLQRGKKPLLNQALTKYQESKRELTEAQKSYDQYLTLNQQYQELVQENDKLKEHQKNTFKQLRLVQKDEQNWNNYAMLQKYQKEQIELLSGFTNNDMSEFKDLNNKINFLKDQIKKLQTTIYQQQENSANDSATYKLYLANKNKFDDLYSQLDTQINNERNYKSTKNDLQQREQDLDFDNDVAGGNDSLEFNVADKNLVNQLIDKKQSLKANRSLTRETKQPSRSNNLWMLLVGAGLVLTVIGIGLGGNELLGLLLAGIICMGIGIYFKLHLPQSSTTSLQISYDNQIKKIDLQLQQIADKYQIKDEHPETWTTTLQHAIKKRNAHRQHIESIRQQLNDDYQELLNYLKSWDLLELNYQDFNQSLNEIKQFMLKVHSLQNQKKVQQEKQVEKLNEISGYQKQIEDLEQQQQLFLRKRNVVSFADYEQQFGIQQAGRRRQDKIKELQNSLSTNMIERLNQYKNYDELLAEVNQLKVEDAKASEKVTETSEKISLINIEINSLVKNGTYDELRQKVAIQKAEINDLVSKWLTLKLTDEWIEKVLNLASHGRFPQVQALAQKYFNTLTNHHYVSVEYGKKIKVKTAKGTKFEVKELSKGTMQQLYLALIFALTMSFSDEYPMPIMIDDGFVDFDHVRTDAAISLMKEISETTQVIYFTADDRIENSVKSNDLLKLD